MQIITCDIRVGRTKEQKSALAMGLTKAVQEATGVSIDHIFLVMREMPGFNLVVGAPDPGDLSRGAIHRLASEMCLIGKEETVYA